MSRCREFSESELTKMGKMRERRIPTKQIAEYLNTTVYTLDHLFRKDKKRFGKYQRDLKDRSLDYLVQPYDIESYDKFEVIQGDAMIMGDTHIPYHNVDMMNKMIRIAKRDKIKRLIVGGDFTDQKTASIYLNANTERISRKFDNEMFIMLNVLKILSRTFDEITLIAGDHDMRILKKISYIANWKSLGKLVNEVLKTNCVRSSDYYYGILQSGDQTWRLTHPDRATRRPTTKALSIARKFDHNVVQFHGHTFGMEFTDNGKYLAVSMGCMTQSESHEYTMRDVGYPKWRKQFGKIQNGKITIYDESSQLTDWKKELK